MIVGLHTRVDRDIKLKAAEVLENKGVTLSEFIREALTRVAEDEKLPFKMNIPNDETIAAMKESNEIMKRLQKNMMDCYE